MDCKTALAQLEAWGSAQTRKTYERHGVTGPMYGVSFANLNKLAKQLKTDHELACALWRSGNHDARVLATMIADPERVDSALADAWLKACDNAVLADLLASLVSRAKLAPAEGRPLDALGQRVDRHVRLGRAGAAGDGRRQLGRRLLREATRIHRAQDPRAAQSHAVRDEQCADRDRRPQPAVAQAGTGHRQADRQGRSRSRRHQLPDARRRGLYPQDASPPPREEAAGESQVDVTHLLPRTARPLD